MEASIQGHIAVPPLANSLAFYFLFSSVCACVVTACQQKWAGMDGFALGVRGTVIERGEGGADVQGYSLLGLI